VVKIVTSMRLESIGHFAGLERLGMHTENLGGLRLEYGEGADRIILVSVFGSCRVTGTKLRTCVHEG
jgi:hypothetical protein